MSSPSPSPPVRAVTEVAVGGDLAIHLHPEWRDRHSWLVHGVAGRGASRLPADVRLLEGAAAVGVRGTLRTLGGATGLPSLAYARQVHGAVVRHHRELPPGVLVAEACDGHLTRAVGVLLGVTVADCVPLTFVAPRVRAVAVVHAGWRGVAGGIGRATLRAFRRRLDVAPEELEVHLGPSICGGCYEVGPEVHEALGLDRPAAPTPVDLRGVLAHRLVEAGVPAGSVTRSTWCTLCGESPFFSHRGGDPERQMAFVGVAP